MNLRLPSVKRPPPAGLLRDLLGLARGLGATVAHLLKKSPASILPVAPAGTLRLVAAGPGPHACIGCGWCVAACPPKCLTLVLPPGAPGPTLAPSARLELDQLQCTSCARCVEVCPVDALDMKGEIALPTTSRNDAIVVLPLVSHPGSSRDP